MFWNNRITEGKLRISDHGFLCPNYLSPSALMAWERDGGETWYSRYILGENDLSAYQVHMDVGTWFDYLIKEKLGHVIPDVAVCDEGRRIGSEVYAWYLKSGMLADLVRAIGDNTDGVICESTVEGTTPNGTPLLGKPDMYWLTDVPVILDWKCNGIAGSLVSPKARYVDRYPKRGPHKDVMPVRVGGVMVGSSKASDWETQLGTYLMSLGHQSGIGVIHQMTRARDRSFQGTVYGYRLDCTGLAERYDRMWDHLSMGHYWPDMSLDEARARDRLLRGEGSLKLF